MINILGVGGKGRKQDGALLQSRLEKNGWLDLVIHHIAHWSFLFVLQAYLIYFLHSNRRSITSQKTKIADGDTLLYQCTGLNERRFATLENSRNYFRGKIITLLSAEHQPTGPSGPRSDWPCLQPACRGWASFVWMCPPGCQPTL